MTVNDLLLHIEQLVAPLLAEGNVDLVDLTYQKTHVGWTLCFYLDKPGGITLDDCQTWSDRIGMMLDEKNAIPRSYSLEVSSPGLNRPLKKLKDFQNYIGERVDVKLFGPLNGQKNFHGVLVGASEEIVRLRMDEGTETEISRSQIAKANLNPDIRF